jgi:hypothetical protein
MNTPRNVRNFWIQGEVDGKKEAIGTGPRRKDGGFDLDILIREKGNISNKKLNIIGHVVNDKLLLDVLLNGEVLTSIETER